MGTALVTVAIVNITIAVEPPTRWEAKYEAKHKKNPENSKKEPKL